MYRSPIPHPASRALLPAVALTLAVAWFGGGVTVDVTSTDEVLVLLSLPLLAMAAWAWLQRPRPPALMLAALAAAVLLVLVPLLQWLLPLAGGGGARAGIAADMAAAGVSGGISRASLIPLATEHALWSLLPPLSVFLGVALLDHRQRRRAVQVALALVLANLAFGFVQAGLAMDHPLRLHENNGTGFGGALINGNHQASALIIGMLLALALAADARRRHDGAGRDRRTWAWLTAAGACFLCIPLAGSSAGMLIGVLFLALGVAATGVIGRVGGSRVRQSALAALAVVGVLVLVVAGQWMDLAQTDPLRHAAARETWALGNRFLPLGSGVGSFVQTFAQAAGPLFQRGEYVNHAHNEFAQWWLEGGLPALVAAIAVLGVLAWTGLRLLRERRHRSLGLAAWLGLCALLVHSIVDFPLRTLSLMTMAGLLAGLAVAEAARVQQREHCSRRIEAPQQV